MDSHQIYVPNDQLPAQGQNFPLLQQFSYYEPPSTQPPLHYQKPSQHVRRSPVSVAIDLLIDALLLAVGVAFLVFALVVLRFDETPFAENAHTADVLLRAAQVGPTVLPIMFASIVGRGLKSIFAWRLEKGAKIGTLDVLAGSTSLSSVVLTHLTLRVFTSLSAALILVWALSPIGSQAALRVVSLADSHTTTARQYSYVTQNSSFSTYASADIASQVGIASMLFVSSVLAPASIEASPQDLWANVKTPMIEPYEQATDNSSDGWYDATNGTVSYASLVGTPIGNLSREVASAAVEIETSYWHLNCSEVTRASQSSVNITSWGGTKNSIASNTTRSGGVPQNDPDLPTRWIAYSCPSNDGYDGLTTGLCAITTVYVQLHVECQGAVCAATCLRRSRLSNPVPSWTYFDEVRWVSDFSNVFINAFSGHLGDPTALQIYFLDPNNPLNFGNSTPLYDLPADVYGLRLGQLMNSLWGAAAGHVSISQGLDASTAGYLGGPQAVVGTAQGPQTISTRVISCNHTWLIFLIIASLVMISASLLHPVLRLATMAPDLAVNVSTLIRDNRYVHMPLEGSAEDASRHARRVKDYWVRYGDVHSSEMVGHLAVGSIKQGTKVEAIRRDRYYD
ncbi:hypothetical protein SCUP515_07813 [Seiridium cupressi]